MGRAHIWRENTYGKEIIRGGNDIGEDNIGEGTTWGRG